MNIRFVMALIALGSLLGNESIAEECVDLRWKLPNGQLSMETYMQELTGSSSFKLNADKFFGDKAAAGEKTGSIQEIPFPESSSMTTVMEKVGDDKINVFVTMGDVQWSNANEQQDEALREMMRKMAGKVQLRGQVDSSGEVTSFYTPKRQKNLLAIFLQLPKRCVAVGDKWKIDVSMIEMDQNFIPSSATRNNEVELVALESSSNGTIAVLRYGVSEQVVGDFLHPMNGNRVPTKLTMSFEGEGRFNIDQGRWQSLVTEMAMEGTGIMEVDSRQVMAMRPTGATQ